jgi:hypothetical protein
LPDDAAAAGTEGAFSSNRKNQYAESLNMSEKIKLTQMLEDWEEPVKESKNVS